MKTIEDIQHKLNEKGLKVTHQRIAILKSLCKLMNHPTAEEIYNDLRPEYPSISLATVYKTLGTFVENGLLKIVETESGKTRYDHELDRHFHIFNQETGEIKDYYDSRLTELLDEYFEENCLPGIDIKDIKISIIAQYNKNDS